MHRRAFLLSSTALAMQTQKTSAGLISELSGPHLSIYLESLAAADNVGDIGIADTAGGIFDQARRVFKNRPLRTFTNPAEMLQTVQPRLAVVALEAHHAPTAIRLALEHGCHVLAEKPACVRAADFAALVELARNRKRNLMLAFGTRLYPCAQRARQLIASGSIGKVYGAALHYVADQTRLTKPEYQRSWFASKAKAGGGHLIWLGIHYLDIIQYLTDSKIRQVTAQITNAGGQPMDVEDSAAVTFQLENGALGTLNSGYYLEKGYDNSIKVWGSKGWVRFNPSDNQVIWYNAASGEKTEPCNKVDPYHEVVRNAAGAAAGAESPFVSGAECLHTLRTVFAAYESARTGSVVRLP